MKNIWLVLVEVVAKPDTLARSKIGFMNISTWADTREEAALKIEEYLNSFGWHLLNVEQADIVGQNYAVGDQVAGMIERTRANPNAIILGTFHAYKTN